MSGQTRRIFLRNAAWAGAGLIAAPAIIGRAAAAPVWSKGNPFSLGVASGAPTSHGFVLWTRLAPDPLAEDPATPGGMSGDSLPVSYEVATDPAMRHIVRRGTAMAERTYAYSVHEEVRGLKPHRPYWYRFTAGAAQSAIGRAVTLPPATGAVDRLRFAYFSCSHYEQGYFSAYRHAAEEMPDFGIFLGDYIYEYVDTRRPVVRRHSGGVETKSLLQYRNRYAQYRTDADLQRIHATCPALVTWDDHEVQNDYAEKWSQTFDDPSDFLARRAAAYQAFYEHMPLRPAFSEPNGSAMRIYDRYAFGDLLNVHIIDGRQYRSREACNGKPDKGHGHLETNSACPERLDASRSMIGMAQEAWLFDGLAKSRARWNLIAQDVMMAQLRQKVPTGEFAYWTDDWNGYPAGRSRLLQHIHDSKPANPVVITGDIHSFWTNDLKLNFDDASSPTVATELVGTSVSSIGPDYEQFKAFLPDNPHVKFFESRKRGYVGVDLTRKEMLARYQTVSDVIDPNATLSTLARFAVESGKAGAQPG